MDPQALTALNQRFASPDVAQVVAGTGGLPKVVISSPHFSGEMYLHGAHVTSWKLKETGEVLYLSPNSLFQDGLAIRGGVPVCFPWFGDKAGDSAAPAHGFVRSKEWQLESVGVDGDKVIVSMSTENDDNGRRWWPHDFHLVCRASFGRSLGIELLITNTGPHAFTFEEALHAYLAVTDPESATIRGLDGTRYLDKTDNFKEKAQNGDVRFAGETDRVYLDTSGALQLFDSPGKRSSTVDKENSRTTVIWNPWSDKSASLKDLGAGEWKHFVCIETTNVGPFAPKLEPGQTHTMAMVAVRSRI